MLRLVWRVWLYPCVTINCMMAQACPGAQRVSLVRQSYGPAVAAIGGADWFTGTLQGLYKLQPAW
jgi:hypothetical protein